MQSLKCVPLLKKNVHKTTHKRSVCKGGAKAGYAQCKEEHRQKYGFLADTQNKVLPGREEIKISRYLYSSDETIRL
jgi:hypothetical protein